MQQHYQKDECSAELLSYTATSTIPLRTSFASVAFSDYCHFSNWENAEMKHTADYSCGERAEHRFLRVQDSVQMGSKIRFLKYKNTSVLLSEGRNLSQEKKSPEDDLRLGFTVRSLR